MFYLQMIFRAILIITATQLSGCKQITNASAINQKSQITTKEICKCVSASTDEPEDRIESCIPLHLRSNSGNKHNTPKEKEELQAIVNKMDTVVMNLLKVCPAYKKVVLNSLLSNYKGVTSQASDSILKLENRTRNSTIQFQKAQALFALGNHEKALKELWLYKPTNDIIHAFYIMEGAIYYDLNQIDRARTSLSQVEKVAGKYHRITASANSFIFAMTPIESFDIKKIESWTF